MIALPEGVAIGSFNQVKLEALWQRLRGFNARFGEDDMRDPEVFLKQFLAPDAVILEHVDGIMFLQRIRPKLRAEVHVSFWDHKLSAHADLFLRCLVWAMGTFDLERIETYIGANERAVKRFVEKRMGFTHEGTLRSYVLHDGRYLDVDVYSILREEIYGNTGN